MSRPIQDGRAHRHVDNETTTQTFRGMVLAVMDAMAFSPDDVEAVAAIVYAGYMQRTRHVLLDLGIPIPQGRDFVDLDETTKQTFREMVLAVIDAMAIVARR